MAKKPSTCKIMQTAEQNRTLFEANLRAGQRVYLRHAFSEINQASGETWYAAPGTRGKIDLVEKCANGTLYNVAFRGRYTVMGEEKVRSLCRPFSAEMLCATEEEAIHG